MDAGADREAVARPTAEGYEALLRAVPRVVGRSGFRGLTYRAVGREAGLTSGLISYYFKTREKLISEAAALAVSEAIAQSSLVPVSGRIDDFASDTAVVVQRDADRQAFQYELVFEARRNPSLLPYLQAQYEVYFQAVETALEEFDISPDPGLTRLVFAALDGLVLQQLIFDRPAETVQSIEALRYLLKSQREPSTAGQQSGAAHG
jgi:DNA-binding transcriptional regulator YbjK